MIIGIGLDICETQRIREAISRHGERFLKKTFSAAEQAACKASANTEERYAARFAAKEAAMKALGTGWQKGIGFLSIEVGNDEIGAPVLQLHGNAQKLAGEKGVARMHLSLTHTGDYAAAVVVLEGKDKT
ncbi:MAG: holo-ACP synthase [Planctomycetes bacterium]|nr:holo-ACP synthase [Planctomycetota bacterium]